MGLKKAPFSLCEGQNDSWACGSATTEGPMGAPFSLCKGKRQGLEKTPSFLRKG